MTTGETPLPGGSGRPELHDPNLEITRTPVSLYYSGVHVATYADQEYERFKQAPKYTAAYFDQQPVFEPTPSPKRAAHGSWEMKAWAGSSGSLFSELHTLSTILLDEIPDDSGADLKNLSAIAHDHARVTVPTDNSFAYGALTVVEAYLQEHSTPEGEQQLQAVFDRRYAFTEMARKPLEFAAMRTGVAYLRKQLEARLNPDEQKIATANWELLLGRVNLEAYWNALTPEEQVLARERWYGQS